MAGGDGCVSLPAYWELNLFHRCNQASIGVMAFLILNISYHGWQVFLAERQHSVFVLPVKFKIGFDNVIYVVRTIPFDFTDEFCECDFRRHRDSEMNMIYDL
jgi:hypothetical protein